MSSLRARLYDYPVAVTLETTKNDPAGPFAGAMCSVAGTVVVYPLNGPNTIATASPITMIVVAGQYLDFPIACFTTGTTATMFGLVGAGIATAQAGPNARL